MNKLHIILTNRRPFVFSAAMAAVFVLLAGGANALAQPTVWCVPNTSISLTCTAGYGRTTIGAALGATSNGDIVIVGPGYYHESVKIINSSITLLGAQAGNDARVDRHDSSKESVVDANGKGDYAFDVDNSQVVIDGFTIEGGKTGATSSHPSGGIYADNETDVQVLNNILTNNSAGVYVDGNCDYAVIEHNLFKNNNAGTPSGYGIYAYESWNYGIVTQNEFTENNTAAIYIYESQYMTITNNSSKKDGLFLYAYEMEYSAITNNSAENDGAFVSFPYEADDVKFSNNQGNNFCGSSLAGDAAVAIGQDSEYLDISDNDLENDRERGGGSINGIAFTTSLGPGSTACCTNTNVRNNTIKGFPGNGIVVEPDMVLANNTGNPTTIVGNEVRDNGLDGIRIEAEITPTYNEYIVLLDNKAEGNRANDCEDDTTYGTGVPLPTGNIWLNNIGSLSSPAGLCTPGGRHDH